MRRAALQALLSLLLAGCQAGLADATGERDGDAPSTPRGTLWVVRPSALHLQASAEVMVAHPHGGGAVSNIVAQLERGQRLEARAARPGWVQVSAAGGMGGWVPARDVMPRARLGKATVLEEVPYFHAADAVDAWGVATPGTLLFVEAHGEPRSRVHVPERGAAYIASAQLSLDEADVEMSHLIAHAQVADPVEAAETLDEARVRFPTSPLLDALGEHVAFSRTHETPAMPTSKMARPPR